jgi:hypothetical protein
MARGEKEKQVKIAQTTLSLAFNASIDLSHAEDGCVSHL